MSAHAYLAPSSAHIRRQCGAAARMMAQYPSEETEDTREGTAAHWVAEDMIRNGGRNVAEGVIAPNGVMVTEEMIEAGEVYFSDVIAQVPDLQGLHIERRIDCHSISPECDGTPDMWHYRPGHLIVWDYKYGRRYVPAFENWQMIEYVSGILDLLGVTGLNDHLITVDMRVVQPRCFVGGSSVRNWRINAQELRGYFNTARMFEERSLKPDAPATSNPDCRDCCPGQCSAAQAAAYNGVDISMQPQPFDMPPAALGTELGTLRRAAEAIKARQDALEVQALALLKRGQAVPGFRVETSQGRTAWTQPVEWVKALGEVLGVVTVQEKPLTPTQVIKAGVPAEMVTPHTSRPTSLKLVEDDGSHARKVFGGY